jgi:Rrf2 family protein
MAGMFSTKGMYALRAMADLASHDGWVSLGDVSKRQNISRKYLEQVISLMHKAGYVESQRGKGGGYRLTRKPEEYTLGELLRAAEGSLAPVACLQCTNDTFCSQMETCTTVGVWRDLGRVTSAYLDSKTLADLLEPSDVNEDATRLDQDLGTRRTRRDKERQRDSPFVSSLRLPPGVAPPAPNPFPSHLGTSPESAFWQPTVLFYHRHNGITVHQMGQPITGKRN